MFPFAFIQCMWLTIPILPNPNFHELQSSPFVPVVTPSEF